MSQLELFSHEQIIEVIHISPTKEMPLEMFKRCYHFSYFSELMEHPTPTTVKYDENVSSIVVKDMDELLYHMVQDEMIEITFCVPKEWFADALEESES